MKENNYVIGVDEVGRGAIAGPLVIGVASAVWNKKTKRLLKGIKDSKKLSFKQRMAWFKKFKKMPIEFHVVFISNDLIDKKGISSALEAGVKRALGKIKRPPQLVLLDGSLKAPQKYKQKTIIKGDDKIPLISAAAIYAKVKRDLYMMKINKKYPYCFTNHKGYGTREHFSLIRKNGISKIHRRSFLKNIVKK